MTTATARNEQVRRYVENRHIDHIPAAARHGKPWHQLVFWFGGNVNVFNVVLGGVTVSIGLTFWWALAAITIGTVIGALLIALHATQGPRLGVPQSIQSRGQFGFYGAAFMFPAVLLLNVGFIAAELVIQAQAMTGVTAALSLPDWILILAVPSVVIGVFGYRWIHRVMQATAIVVGISLVIMLVQGLRHGTLPASETTLARPSAGLFLAGVALLVIDMLSFGPFVERLHPLPAGQDQQPAPVLGHLRRKHPGHRRLLRDRCLPHRAAAVADPGRGRRKDLRQVGADHHGPVAGQRQHLQRLHRVIPGPGVRQHVAPVQSRVGHRPAGPVPVRHGRGRRDRLPRLPVVRQQLVATSSTCYWSCSSRGPRSTWPTTSWSGTAPTTSPRSSPPTANTAGSPGAGCWPTRSAWPRNGRSSPSPTTPGRWSKPLGGADISWLVGWFTAAIIYLLLIALAPSTARHNRPIATTAR